MNNFEIIACDTDSIFFKKLDGASFSKEEIESLQSSLNSLYPSTIKWELNGYFPVIVSAASKNYLIRSEDGKIKFKGSALRDPKKQRGLLEFVQKFITLLSEDKESEIPELYNSYVREICNLKDIKRWTKKITITEKVLNPERTNEQKVYDAVKNIEGLQEGDKIQVYFRSDRSLALEKDFDGDYDQKGLLKSLHDSALIFEDLYPVREKLPNYALKRSQDALKSLLERPEEKYIANLPEPLKTLVMAQETIPKPNQVFRALSYFKPQETKVIIIGQDPYPNEEDACGLAFSVEHEKYPPSLLNIFKELLRDVGLADGPNILRPKTGNLEPWAKQGVLLLNSILTTEKGKSLAHKGLGWEQITTKIIQRVLDYKNPVVIIAWGKYAQQKLQDLKIHDRVLLLTGGHPSPLNVSGGFFGGRYFSRANEFLKENKMQEINWKL